jgi:hypothetical protein
LRKAFAKMRLRWRPFFVCQMRVHHVTDCECSCHVCHFLGTFICTVPCRVFLGTRFSAVPHDGGVVRGTDTVLSRSYSLLESLFVGRTDMLVNGVHVDVRHPGLQLPGTNVWDRLGRLMAPAGIACARHLLDQMALQLSESLPVVGTHSLFDISQDIGSSHLWAYLNEGVSHVVCWYQGPAHPTWVC